MLAGFLGGLIIAWFLSWIHVSGLIIQGINDLFHVMITVPAYYVIFGIAGAITGFFAQLRTH